MSHLLRKSSFSSPAILRFGLVLALLLALPSASVAASAAAGEPEITSLASEIQQMDDKIRKGVSQDGFEQELLRLQLDDLEMRAHRSGSRALQTKVERLRSLQERFDDPAKAGNEARVSAERWPEFSQVVGKIGGAPSNDACGQAENIFVNSPILGTTNDATVDGEAGCGSSLFTPDVWFHFQAPATERYRVRIPGASYDTVVSVHTVCPGTLDDEITCNDDFDGLLSSLSFDAQAGNSYWIRVSGFHLTTGDFTVEIDRTSVITGRVTDALDGPLADCQIQAFVDTPFGANGSGSVFTAADGTYEFLGLPAGTYYLRAHSCNGFLSMAWDDLPSPGGFSYSWTPIEVADDAVVSGIDLVLPEGGSIGGQVLDASNGLPLADIWMRIQRADGVMDDRSAFTNEDGEYLFEGLYPGDHQLWTRLSGLQDEVYDDIPCPGGLGSCPVASGDLVPVADQNLTPDIDFSLDPLGVVTGLVQTPSGVWSGAGVSIFDSAGDFVNSGLTDVNGEFEVGGLRTGTHYAVAGDDELITEIWPDLPVLPGDPFDPTTGDPIAVTVGQTTSGVDFMLDERGSVSGTVTEAATGQEVPNARVRLYADDGTLVMFDGVAGTTYLLSGIFPGTYYVEVRESTNLVHEGYDDIHCLGDCDLPLTPVAVALNSETTGIDFALEEGGVVKGTVTNSANATPVQAAVEIYDSAGTLRESTVADATGLYKIKGVPTGSYYLRARRIGYRSEVYDDIECDEGCDVTIGAPVAAALGATTNGIDFALDPLGSISGQVTRSAGGAGIPNVVVEVFDSAGDLVTEAYTDESGSYLTDWLPVGTYYARTTESLSATFVHQLHAGMSCHGGCDPTTGTPIPVTSGSNASVDFALERLGEIAATIEAAIEATESPGSLHVDVYDAIGQFVGEAGSSEDYRLSGLEAGTYYAIAHSSTGLYDSELYEEMPCNGCDPTTGTPIVVALDTVTPISFTLALNQSVEGTILDATTGEGLYGVEVYAYNMAANPFSWSARTFSEEGGYYRFAGLEPGTYYFRIEALGYIDELYADIPCLERFGYQGCDPYKGTPIEVVADASVSGIDVELEPFAETHPVILGRVTDGEGDPIEGVFVDLWSNDGGGHVASAMSDSNGDYRFDLPATMDVFVSTHNEFGLTDEIYDDYQCVNGSVRDGLCWYRNGEKLFLRQEDDIEVGIDFVLEFLFADGFESGDTSRWSSTVGDP